MYKVIVVLFLLPLIFSCKTTLDSNFINIKNDGTKVRFLYNDISYYTNKSDEMTKHDVDFYKIVNEVKVIEIDKNKSKSIVLETSDNDDFHEFEYKIYSIIVDNESERGYLKEKLSNFHKNRWRIEVLGKFQRSTFDNLYKIAFANINDMMSKHCSLLFDFTNSLLYLNDTQTLKVFSGDKLMKKIDKSFKNIEFSFKHNDQNYFIADQKLFSLESFDEGIDIISKVKTHISIVEDFHFLYVNKNLYAFRSSSKKLEIIEYNFETKKFKYEFGSDAVVFFNAWYKKTYK